jgi:hypothetical protein
VIEIETNAVEVGKALARYLAALPRVMFGVVQVWTAQVADQVRRAAPVDEGGLAASCSGEASAGPDGPDAVIVAAKEYAPPVEFGSVPHEIHARRGWVRHALCFPGKDGGLVFRQSVNHPGTKPQPFFFDSIDGSLPHLGTLANQSLDELGRQVGLDGER